MAAWEVSSLGVETSLFHSDVPRLDWTSILLPRTDDRQRKNSVQSRVGLCNQQRRDQDKRKTCNEQAETPFSQFTSPAVNTHQATLEKPMMQSNRSLYINSMSSSYHKMNQAKEVPLCLKHCHNHQVNARIKQARP